MSAPQAAELAGCCERGIDHLSLQDLSDIAKLLRSHASLLSQGGSQPPVAWIEWIEPFTKVDSLPVYCRVPCETAIAYWRESHPSRESLPDDEALAEFCAVNWAYAYPPNAVTDAAPDVWTADEILLGGLRAIELVDSVEDAMWIADDTLRRAGREGFTNKPAARDDGVGQDKK